MPLPPCTSLFTDFFPGPQVDFTPPHPLFSSTPAPAKGKAKLKLSLFSQQRAHRLFFMPLPSCLPELAFWEWISPWAEGPTVEPSDPVMEAGGLPRRSEGLFLSCCCSFLPIPCQKFRMARCPPTVCPMVYPTAYTFTAMASGCQRAGRTSGEASLTCPALLNSVTPCGLEGGHALQTLFLTPPTYTPQSQGAKGFLEEWLVVPVSLLLGMTPVQDSFMSTSLLLHWLRVSTTVPITYHGKLGQG